MGTTTDSGSVRITHLAPGKHDAGFSAVGYTAQKITLLLPDTSVLTVYLQAGEKELEQVVISTTRTNQRIENSPLKVEVLGKEELDEENTIKPGNIASLLSDVSGIQVQQSSAVSGNANVRIQGLEGRYTQILRDGLPLFDGFSGGFGVLTIPPLDLRQIELVKGSASTLYGGGAIGGLINLISKRPQREQEAILTLNRSTLKESNGNTYLSRRADHIGYTLFAGYTGQGATDVDGDGFTDVPQLDAVILHPRLFFYPNAGTTLSIGYTGTFEKRVGGDKVVVEGAPTTGHQFFERNQTNRNTGELLVEKNFTGGSRGTIKASLSSFDRTIETNTYHFSGNQLNYFAEASLVIPKEHADWVGGLNVLGDRFRKDAPNGIALDNFSNATIGAFVQNSARIGASTTLETGLRADHHLDYGTFILPRIALFHRFTAVWASRVGFGAGYKTPSALAPQNVEYDITDIQPIGPAVKAEKSYGFNAEVNFKIPVEEGSLFINQAWFLTRLQSPLVATESPTGKVVFNNAPGAVVSEGLDTYLQVLLDDWELYAGYTFTLAERRYLPGHPFVPLTPKNRLAFTVVNEIEGKWRFGLEGSYTGPQYRDGDSRTPGYFFAAAMIQRDLGPHLSLILNGENLLDYRQSKEEALYTGAITDPHFKPLWAPTDGRVINLSLRLKR